MGTMRERKPGTWEVRAFLGRDATGRPRQVSRTVHGGKREARRVLSELEAEANAGKHGKPDTATLTVAALLDRHLANLERLGRSPTTIRTYRGYVTQLIAPALGGHRVRNLAAYDLDQLYGHLADTGRSPATIRQVHAILSGALGQAVRWGLIPVSPAKSASPPPARSAKVTPPTLAEVRKLIELAEERSPVLAPAILLAAITGCRRGELCALRWDDVDLQAGTLRVARALLDLPTGVVEAPTKSHTVRTLALGAAGVTLLATHRAQVAAWAEQLAVPFPADGFVFSPNLGAAPYRPNAVTAFFGRLRDDLNLPHVHLHSLRHWAATQMAASGTVSARTLAGRLGHADASVSLRVYSAFFQPADADAADMLGRLLEPPTTPN